MAESQTPSHDRIRQPLVQQGGRRMDDLGGGQLLGAEDGLLELQAGEKSGDEPGTPHIPAPCGISR